MDRFDEITLGDIGRSVGRYRPFIAVLTGILLVAVFLPGEQSGTGGVARDLTSPTGEDGTRRGRTELAVQRPGSTETGETSGAASGGTVAADATGPSAAGADGGPSPSEDDRTQRTQAAGTVGLNATCDQAAGHIAIPSLVAPPCVQAGPNTGDDTRGVTGDTIKIVRYLLQGDPASDAILTAAGVNDSDEETEAQVRDWIDYYTHHHETYGRDIEVVFVKQSGESESALIADARKVAEEIGAFASINPGGTPGAYTDEVTARGVMCLGCMVSQPLENYHEAAPYSWGTLMASSELYIHRAEYIGKRLWQAGKKAEFAGDPAMQLEDRRFGLLYYNNEGAYESGAAFFETHLEERWGIDLAVRRDYIGYPRTAESQEAARPLIQALKEAGVTSVVCACDPFAPVFFTQEATRQNYFPEWVVIGSALTDTTLFARTYDQQQWENAFGISQLTARVPEELDEDLRLLKWHFGEDYEPPADANGPAALRLFFYGVHLAGPTLTPQTFQQGMFGMPPRAAGHIMQETMSFGSQNWPHDSYTAFDDITMLWWDRSATGEDEVGTQGVGMYRYVDMGKRYMPDEQPQAPPKAFQTENTVTVYDGYPPGDEPPQYPHRDE